MLKPSTQLSCQLQATHNMSVTPTRMDARPTPTPTKISPQDILRPKPRRITSQTQLSRHCTSADLSRMRASPQTGGAVMVVSPVQHPVPSQMRETPVPVAGGRPSTPVNPFRRDTCGGSAPVLSHLNGNHRRDGSPRISLSPFPSSPVRNIPSGRESTGSSVRSQTPQKSIKPIRETPPIRHYIPVGPIHTTTAPPKPARNSVTPHTSTPVPKHLYAYYPSKSTPALDDQSIYDVVDEDEEVVVHESHPRPPAPVPLLKGMFKGSPSTTECGSLSKSSSDGTDPIVNKKKVLSKLKSRRRNILCFAAPANVVSGDEQYGIYQQSALNRAMSASVGRVRQGCYGGSSSDENRSSGHASMSTDSTRSSFLSASSPVVNSMGHTGAADHHIASHNTDAFQVISGGNSRHVNNVRKCGVKSRKKLEAINDSIFVGTGGQHMGLGSLEGVRAAIEQISLRTHGGHSTSTYSSNYSGSEYEPTFRRLIRHSSLETIGTNITSAGDDFVWVDTHSRLVELQHIPWDTRDVLTVIQEGRLQHQLSRISMDCVPRLSYLLQRPLVRIAVEAQRLAKPLGLCTKHEVCGAVRVLLSAQLADTCVKSGHRAAAIFAVSGGPDTFRQSKSGRAGLQLSVGRFHRWMCDTRMGQYVDEYSAIYMTGAMENLLEEIILHCLSITGADCILTASLLDTCVANNTDFWGVLQPFAHLIAGRTANGVLSLPPGLQITGTGSASVESTGSTDGSKTSAIKGLEQKLLTTCVGSVQQLDEIISSVSQYRVSNPQTVYRRNGHNWWSTHHWSMASLHSLYYYMRCAQLEHNQCAPVADPTGQTPLSQELVYERPFLVLPPLYEWMRVCAAHAYYRRCPVIDKDDVLQAARLLLPGIDCPVRPLTPTTSEEWLYFRPDLDASECLRRLKVELAFRMLSCGRPDVLTHALQLLPHNTGINTVDDSGLTALMRACIAGDIRLVRVLCDANCDVNVETPAPPTHKNRERYGSNGHVMAETQHWTALCYACIHGHREIVNILLDMGANVEGGYRYGEEMATQTPLQLAASAGRIDIVKVLLTYGADPYLTTTVNDSAVAHCSASRGSSSAIALAAMHGQQLVLRALVVQPTYGHNSSSHKDVLSLEEMLAEGRNSSVDSRRPRIQVVATNQSQSSLNTSDGGTPGAGGHSPEGSSSGSNQKVIQLTKPKLRALQEAMYHSAEGGCLEITLDLRNIGIPWTMHTWMQTVGTTHAMRLDAITSQLLQDFTHLWCDDCSTHFIDQCLPLLFTIFRHQKHNTGTALLLADIISTCYGRQAVKCRPLSASFANGSDVRVGARIDAKYVNNKDMSDCVFKVENRLFFAHKIILVNASKRFHNMLTTGAHQTTGAPDGGNGSPPQQSAPIVVNDIRFDIFQKVMQFLYNGGFDTDSDVDQNDILELMSAAAYFQLDGLLRYCSRRCCDCVSEDSVVSLYMNAIQYNALELMQFCQKYMLENLVPLLERDPQISQLLFQGSSKVNITNKPDHLSALLFTLQQRCRDRQQQVLQKQQQNGAKNQFSR